MNAQLEYIKKGIASNRNLLERDFSLLRVGVFGSIAKNEATDKSDIDLLVEFNEPIGLFRFEELRLFLQDLFGRKIDLVTPRALKPLLKDEILQSVIYL